MNATEFNRLADLWDAETGFHSNPYCIIDHDSYRAFLREGESLLYLILKRYREDMNLKWSWLLNVITNEDPTTEAVTVEGGFAKTDVEAARDAWMAWAVKNGYFSK